MVVIDGEASGVTQGSSSDAGLVGYGVMAMTPDVVRDDRYAYSIESAMFSKQEQAWNARQFLVNRAKRDELNVRYLVCEIRQCT